MAVMRIGRDLTWVEEHALARKFLQQKGYEILRDNYSRGLNHVDFIALDETERLVLFIDLKLKHQDSVASENPRVDFNKKRFEHLSLLFMSSYPCLRDCGIQADQLTLIQTHDGRVFINYYSNVASIVFS